MLKEDDYVTLDVAKTLKEKGFNEPCFEVFTPKNPKEYRLSRRFPAETDEDICHVADGCAFEEFLAPSLAQASRWLIENHKIAVCPNPYDFYWNYIIYDLKVVCKENYTHKVLGSRVAWASYEEALNEGIKQALQLLK